MENFITCAEASKVKNDTSTGKLKEFLTQANKAIATAAAGQLDRVHIKSGRLEAAETFLKNNGYTVSYQYDQRDGDFYTISGR